ncbi:sensor histidine kinase [Candidatus Marithrix sp. Canyon 246]|uniref:sensor histidine kinase n=1 Tax=Candidatus Marithrix sp. Canyon 246 TaxID=1827136 RepID=UPI00084A1C50|nr:ATP-binding protein [Candidatus Marithrix sp. Canyon 246]
MSITSSKLKKWLNISLLVVSLIILLASLWIITEALHNSERFEHLYSILLLINIMALLALLTLIGLNLHNLLNQVHQKRAGAHLTLRLVSSLTILSTIPVLIVYYFSLTFLHNNLDNLSDIHINKALNHALDLSRADLDARMRESFKKTQTIIEKIALENDMMISLQLNELRKNSGAAELILLAPNGRIIASNSVYIEQLLPHRPSESVLLQLKQSDSYISIKPIENSGLHIRVIIKFFHNHQQRLLHALFPIPTRISELTQSVEEAIHEFREKAYLANPVKDSLTLVLSLVVLLSVLSAAWMAFFVARHFVKPLSQLLEGTKAVANGNYEKQLPSNPFYDLDVVVQSFNDMTTKISQARDEVNNQRAYLETVLERLSSGVISIDSKQQLQTANSAAAKILGLSLDGLSNNSITNLKSEYPSLQELCNIIEPHLLDNDNDWSEEINLFGGNGRQVLKCSGTMLQLKSEGYVIVFDDITTMVQAQKTAAWSEVARRLAHEIKNPLTPIQLSAERLRQKYLHKLPAKDAGTLDRMTNTIIQQVDTMKDMVNAFSDYARTPKMNKTALNLNQLIKEVLELYHHSNIKIKTVFDDNLPKIDADRGRLRQVLHNLIKNGLEAKAINNEITISTNYQTNNGYKCIEISIQDQGPGISEKLIDKIFEPYITTKQKGTGLGLAIVKKIIEEHNGTVWIENTSGACVVIRLPTI